MAGAVRTRRPLILALPRIPKMRAASGGGEQHTLPYAASTPDQTGPSLTDRQLTSVLPTATLTGNIAIFTMI